MTPILPVASISGDRVKIQGCQCLEVYPGQVDFVVRPRIQPAQNPIVVPGVWMVFENLPNIGSDCFLSLLGSSTRHVLQGSWFSLRDIPLGRPEPRPRVHISRGR